MRGIRAFYLPPGLLRKQSGWGGTFYQPALPAALSPAVRTGQPPLRAFYLPPGLLRKQSGWGGTFYQPALPAALSPAVRTGQPTPVPTYIKTRIVEFSLVRRL